ncbi:hypothetical protein COEREDRAFT_79046 [Coemansia reversa NRRL 1564]|uniref:Uncharacterized protein n=1 Tax=Coemansia reversa (strain ATCC 12441 / NRRL 1564) TaxID=763665 RepID=A0A2G5BL91_COERN|nr:hypothetical protein COEREDRAFT_79046 [Coemansia reversa NRRL 1564]|eukprot:PIA19773.1 hypothetical protein COEREDRAFT_79046 [Coemansia reversa NRRL 1564]
MAGPSLADLKKQQLQRRQQQQKQRRTSYGLKRKRDAPTVAADSQRQQQQQNPKKLDAYFQQGGKPATSSSIDMASAAIAKTAQSSSCPFAATPHVLAENPFDIITNKLDLQQTTDYMDNGDERDDVVIIGDGYSDSDGDLDNSKEYGGYMDNELVDGDYERELDENDPSLYKLITSEKSMSLASAVPNSSPSMMQIDDDNDNDSGVAVPTKTNHTTDVIKEKREMANDQSSNVNGNPRARNSESTNVLSFSRPPESLSLRTQVSVTSEVPLEKIEALSDEGTFLSLTSLCHLVDNNAESGSYNKNPLTFIADALVHWEAVGKKFVDIPQPSNSKSSTNSPGTTTEAQMKQAFASLFRLQKEAPRKYPFIYLHTRDYVALFKMIPASSKKKKQQPDDDNSGPNKAEYKRVAVISQSYLGLRRILHNEGVEFSLPLAPQVNSWSEIPDVTMKNDGLDTSHLRTTAVDKTWRSAMLIIGGANVNGLFSHLYSTQLESACLYSTGSFLNATMRRASLRFSNAISYENINNGTERIPKQLYKLDINGVVFPSAWNNTLRALAALIGEREFGVSFKETQETAHLNMLVSKQGSAVSGKKSIIYTPHSNIFTYN